MKGFSKRRDNERSLPKFIMARQAAMLLPIEDDVFVNLIGQ
jgi:hypothetical protein